MTQTHNMGAPCAVADCTAPAHSRGWCPAHYHRWERYGDPLAGGPPKARESYIAVDSVRYTTSDVRALLSMAQRCDGLRLRIEHLEAENARLARALNQARSGALATKMESE